MTEPLAPLPALATVRERLREIFPDGTAQRNYFVRDLAAKTVFVLLYLGAVEGSDRWARPNQVTRMTDAQAERSSAPERVAWAAASLKAQGGDLTGRWFADTTREPIRDETLRNALLTVAAVVERPGLTTTSSLPRWALASDFAALFTVPPDAFAAVAAEWRARRLSPQALARVALAHGGLAGAGGDAVLVRFPNGEARRLTPGPSAEITRAVVEAFAPRYLAVPGVLWISESRTQVAARDDALARRVGLDINRQELLPDVILVDLGAPDPPLFVFVEVVASDGPVNEDRKRALLDLVRAGGHGARNAAFVTAFHDRERPEYRKVIGAVAWNSFVWCATEADKIIVHRDASGAVTRLTDLIPSDAAPA